VLKFRPRTLATLPAGRGTWATSLFSTKPARAERLSRYERDRDEPDEFFAIVCWQMLRPWLLPWR